MLTIDANFRLKMRDRGILSDPPLADGWGHFVPMTQYKAYTDTYGHQAEVSQVTSFTTLTDKYALYIYLSNIA
jgi:hypothetical protein